MTPPITMAEMGIRNGPKPKTEFHKPYSPALLTATNDPNAIFSGGADRDRTGGLLVANQALSQLSYSPNFQDSASST